MSISSIPGAPSTTTAEAGSTAEAAQLLVMKKAMNLQAAGAAQLIEALPQPALATSGTLGTQVNTYA